jgi:hypothetical protein
VIEVVGAGNALGIKLYIWHENDGIETTTSSKSLMRSPTGKQAANSRLMHRAKV